MRVHRSLAPALLLALAATPLAPLPAAASEPSGIRSTAVTCPGGNVPEDGFTDVSAGSPHEQAVDCIVWWRIAQGRGGSEYGASLGVERGAMASFVANTIEAAGGVLPDAPADAFTDDQGLFHEFRTNQLAAIGVVGGTGDGTTYSPSRTVTRGQMAKFLALAAEHLSGEPLPAGQDRFADDDGTTFESFIDQIAEAGVTGGSADGRYNAGATVQREQMGSFLARTHNLLVQEGQPAQPRRTSPYTGAPFDAACPPEQIRSAGYTDTADDPYRDAIDCAAHWQVMRGTSQDTFGARTLTQQTRAQTATYAALLFDALGGTRPDEVPDAYRDDESSVHQGSINLMAAIGASPVGEDRLFYPQELVTAQEVTAFLDGVYAAVSGAPSPFTSQAKDRPVLRAEMAAELVAYLSAGVEAGYATVPE